ncbi:hypothetical protein LWI28_011169 [Acer negundo]|uniref:Uncharacterized protein n=1 Tax=Acer negundo TaxID=4023 RepID=A0AAD5II05_ACENE|nr:hypothetical protein LWI28_011169 [Acer negundo]
MLQDSGFPCFKGCFHVHHEFKTSSGPVHQSTARVGQLSYRIRSREASSSKVPQESQEKVCLASIGRSWACALPCALGYKGLLRFDARKASDNYAMCLLGALLAATIFFMLLRCMMDKASRIYINQHRLYYTISISHSNSPQTLSLAPHPVLSLRVLHIKCLLIPARKIHLFFGVILGL